VKYKRVVVIACMHCGHLVGLTPPQWWMSKARAHESNIPSHIPETQRRWPTFEDFIFWAAPQCPRLDLCGCTGLTALPDLPNAEYLYLSGCTGLTVLPKLPSVQRLDLDGCTGLTVLPELPSVQRLDLSGCAGLKALPELPSGCRVYK